MEIELGSLFVQIAKCICLKLHNVFVSKCICLNVFTRARATGHRVITSGGVNVGDWIAKCICPNLKCICLKVQMFLSQNVFVFKSLRVNAS